MFERFLGRKETALTNLDPDITMDQVAQIWNKLGGKKGVDRLLSGKMSVVDKWWEEDDVVYLSLPVVNDGKNAERWIEAIEHRRGRKPMIWDEGRYNTAYSLKTHYQPEIRIVKVAILRGSFFKGKEITEELIRAEASKRGLVETSPGLMLCLAAKLTVEDFKEIGLEEIVGMHKQIPRSLFPAFAKTESREEDRLMCEAGLLKLGLGFSTTVLSTWEHQKFPSEWGYVFEMSGTSADNLESGAIAPAQYGQCQNFYTVKVEYEDGDECEYIVSQADIDKFVRAFVHMHNELGRNPHRTDSENIVIKINRITAKQLVAGGPYWWTTPDLMKNHDPRGAKIWDWGWEHDKVILYTR